MKNSLKKKNKYGLRAKLQPLFFMAICLTACASVVPDNLPDDILCAPERLKGGIVQALVSSCDVDWSDANKVDGTFWDTQIAADKLKATGRIKGSGFNVTEQTEDTDGCLPPEVSGRTWEAVIKDFNVDLTTNLDWTFWNTISQGRNKWQVAFRTSEDYLFGFFTVTLSNKLTLPDNCDQYFFRELSFKWKSLDEPKRVYIPFLQTKFPI